MGVEGFGALCFGLVIGWITYRALRRKKEESSVAEISSVIGAVGGAAVTALFKSGEIFGMYCIGLAAGFFLYFVIALLINRKKEGFDVFETKLMGSGRQGGGNFD